MTGKPILFSGPMVRAIRDGRKTQTRRIIKPQPTDHGLVFRTACGGDFSAWEDDGLTLDEGCQRVCPYGQPGDLLWVRETWDFRSWDKGIVLIAYGADGSQREAVPLEGWSPTIYNYERWRPSIHMPRWASRLTLRITDVRVERLQNISEEDALAEGVSQTYAVKKGDVTARQSFSFLWDSINAKRGYLWESNPWVWMLAFEAILRNIEEVQHDRAALALTAPKEDSDGKVS